MNSSQTVGKLMVALAKAQTEIKPAEFDSVNPFFKTKYASLAAIEAAIRPLANNGIAHIQTASVIDGRVTVTTRLAFEDEWIEGELSLKPEGDTTQKVGSVITYGRRYLLAAMTGCVADTDTDGEPDRKRGADKKPEPPEPPSAPAPEPPPPSLTPLRRFYAAARQHGLERADVLALFADELQYPDLHEKDGKLDMASVPVNVLELAIDRLAHRPLSSAQATEDASK